MRKLLAYTCAMALVATYTLTFAKDFLPSQFTDGILKSYSSQLYFEQNLGQYDPEIKYQAHVYSTQIRFLPEGLSYASIREKPVLSQASRQETPSPSREKFREHLGYLGEQEHAHEALVWNTHFVNMNPSARMEAVSPEQGSINYLKGSDSWIRNVRRYEELWYEEIYPSIDLRYYGTSDQQLKYDFILHPGSDLSAIAIRFEGINKLSISDRGELLIHTDWGIIAEAAPYSYQMLRAHEETIHIHYELRDSVTLGFRLEGFYYPNLPIVLDPISLDWSTFFHSSNSDDYMMAVKKDEQGNVYATGYTKSFEFPTTPGVYQDLYGGNIDNYIVKFKPDGRSIDFATYIGGSDWELTYGIAVGKRGETYVTGFSRSTDFPTTQGCFQPQSNQGEVEGYILCLNPEGSDLGYSTFFGGSDRDYIYDIAVNEAGEVFVTGLSMSHDLPVSTDAFQALNVGSGDSFAARLSADGSELIYSTFIGGNGYEIGQGLALTASNELVIAGNTTSTNFPTTVGVLQENLNSVEGRVAEDAFVCRISADGSRLIWSGYYGGGDSDAAYAVALGEDESVYITGMTYSLDFPTSFEPLQQTIGGTTDAFLVELSSDLSEMRYSSTLGGQETDFGKAIAVNEYGDAYILGATRSPGFPVTPDQTSHLSMYDIFLTVINTVDSELKHSTVWGGLANEYPRAAGALFLEDGVATLGLTTHSEDMPMTGNTYQGTKTNGDKDSPVIMSARVDFILPIEWGNVSANRVDDYALLQWDIYIGEGEGHFEVERRFGYSSWEILANVSNNTGGMFSYVDKDTRHLMDQEIVYRVVYRDVGGNTFRSPQVGVWIETRSNPDVYVYPNPANGEFWIEISGEMDGASYQIFNSMGQQVYNSLPLSSNTFFRRRIDTDNWTPGEYIMVMQHQGGTDTKIILVQ